MEPYMHTYDSFASRNDVRYIPTSRMQVMNSVYLPASDVDIRSGRLQPDRQRRCRTQAIRLEQESLERENQLMMEAVLRESKKGGVRITRRMLIFTVALTLFCCGLILLLQQSMIAQRQKAINRLERSISDYVSQNGSLEAQIAEASDAATICYAASQNLNMIPAEAADAIHLVAVSTRPEQATQPQTVTADQQSGQMGNGQVTVMDEYLPKDGGNAPVSASTAH